MSEWKAYLVNKKKPRQEFQVFFKVFLKVLPRISRNNFTTQLLIFFVAQFLYCLSSLLTSCPDLQYVIYYKRWLSHWTRGVNFLCCANACTTQDQPYVEVFLSSFIIQNIHYLYKYLNQTYFRSLFGSFNR